LSDLLFQLDRSATTTLQAQIREAMVSAILSGQLPLDRRIPSSREMAKTLGVSRNTVMLAYQGLIDDEYLIANERSGYFVNGKILRERALARPTVDQDAAGQLSAPNWNQRFRVRPAALRNISKPVNWHAYPYPFIYGQIDHTIFPIADWRECSRQTLGKKWLDAWTDDARDQDDPMLVDQIRKRILPRRGILADPDEILITLGAQNALYILASLLITPDSVVGIEDPGYTDARNIFSMKTERLIPLPVDDDGLIVDERTATCDIVFTTPSHQYPTTATMSRARRSALLAMADKKMIVIEDDYEFETNYRTEPTPALKARDGTGRVIYVGSLSKTLFPGLRLGFLVGSRELIQEARVLRRLMIRHPPSNNQRTVALFLSLGYHDALVRRLHRIYRQRWEEMGRALNKHLPNSSTAPSFGGTSYWVRGPAELDADRLAVEALKNGIIIEPGSISFAREPVPKNFFRLGFSSIDIKRIEPGIERLAALIAAQTGD